MLPQVFISVLALPLLVSGHFHVVYPEGRNPNEDDTEPNSPCGGCKQSSNRTQVSFPSFPVALELEHDRSVIQMNLALGNDPTSGANFNIALERSFQQQGEGTFCLPEVVIPSDLDITNGQNATLQVITDGEAGGGLYVCADITFTSTTMSLPSVCKNTTGVTAMPLGSNINANQSTAGGSPQAGNPASPSASASASAFGVLPSNQAESLTAGWGVLGGAVLGAVALI